MSHDIVGIAEIAKMADVSSQVVVNWRSRASDFPQPLRELASGPVFRGPQVRAWLKRNNRNLNDFGQSSTFYPRLKNFRGDDDTLSSCINNVVRQLENSTTSSDKPGMLLGKIQSGKTRAFVGVIAGAFDQGFDIALVLTKGTKTLSAQTVARLGVDFYEFIDEDELLVLDIMKLPGKLTKSELRRKIVVVAKKQKHNLDRLADFVRLMQEQPGLQQKKVLIIDDEADLASIRFVKKRGESDISQGTIADQIDTLRNLSSKVAFLQVTATPYSLYLQPENYEDTSNCVFKPKRPSFTEILPIHGGYVGGDDYFGAHEEGDPRARLIVEVAEQEQDALRKPDKRRFSQDNIMTTPNAMGMRKAIVTFITAVNVRQWQQREQGEKPKKYSMIIHNDVQKSAHAWQSQIIDWIFEGIVSAAKNNHAVLRPMFDEAFTDLEQSVSANGGKMPLQSDAFDAFIDALLSDDVVVEEVNSDKDVLALLDEKAELRLRTPYNIFVGGNILDRGITIPNLIAFYYGRNPRTMQADTVLQHSRMYGNRNRDDLAATRLYTSRAVFDRLYTINAFENALRKAFENGAHDQGVVFIQTDGENRVRPCAPNKVLLSNVVSVSPETMLLPSNFDITGGTRMMQIQRKLDQLIKPEWCDSGQFIPVDRQVAQDIINTIQGSMKFDGAKFEWNAMYALMDYYAQDGDGKILLLAETGRKLDRKHSGDKSGKSILGTKLRATVLDRPRSKPALILLQQQGGKSLNWGAQHSFWWPILAAPIDAEPCVFATKTAA